MKKSIKIIIAVVSIILLAILLFFTLNKKNTNTKTTGNITKTSTASKEIELGSDEKPIVSLIPRADGHELKFKVTNIPSKFSTAEYELIYTAEDEGLEIEKGVSGTVKLEGSSLEKDLLLGTSSCTNGCKYKYDEGITGGTLVLILTTNNKEYFTFETPFVLRSSVEINKNKSLSLSLENFIINGTVTGKSDFFIAIKNVKSVYSVFSNGTGKGKITSIEPATVTKTDLTSITGDYTIAQ